MQLERSVPRVDASRPMFAGFNQSHCADAQCRARRVVVEVEVGGPYRRYRGDQTLASKRQLQIKLV